MYTVSSGPRESQKPGTCTAWATGASIPRHAIERAHTDTNSRARSRKVTMHNRSKSGKRERKIVAQLKNELSSRSSNLKTEDEYDFRNSDEWELYLQGESGGTSRVSREGLPPG